jgi:hypothetical protein
LFLRFACWWLLLLLYSSCLPFPHPYFNDDRGGAPVRSFFLSLVLMFRDFFLFFLHRRAMGGVRGEERRKNKRNGASTTRAEIKCDKLTQARLGHPFF